ncbi:MAG TPA: flagellar biosynthesis protein FliQ [Bacillota bacterium]|nr:flagellar biosynthesis protein FliQ [Bacillota bacterium]
MTQDFVVYLAREALFTVLLVSAPILGLSLLVGLLVSIFQATTQIQEATLAFVPKIVAVLAAIVFFGPWMLNILLAFTNSILGGLHTLAR